MHLGHVAEEIQVASLVSYCIVNNRNAHYTTSIGYNIFSLAEMMGEELLTMVITCWTTTPTGEITSGSTNSLMQTLGEV